MEEAFNLQSHQWHSGLLDLVKLLAASFVSILYFYLCLHRGGGSKWTRRRCQIKTSVQTPSSLFFFPLFLLSQIYFYQLLHGLKSPEWIWSGAVSRRLQYSQNQLMEPGRGLAPPRSLSDHGKQMYVSTVCIMWLKSHTCCSVNKASSNVAGRK